MSRSMVFSFNILGLVSISSIFIQHAKGALNMRRRCLFLRVILLVCGFSYFCKLFGAHLKMMKADRMLDSKHGISGNET